MKKLENEAALTFKTVAKGDWITMTTVCSGGAFYAGPLLRGCSDGNGGPGQLVDHPGPLIL